MRFYLDRPFVHNGNTYPVLKAGYDPAWLPEAVKTFKYLKIVGGDEELKEYLTAKTKEASKFNDPRANTDFYKNQQEIDSLKQEVKNSKSENENLRKMLADLQTEVLEIKRDAQKKQPTKNRAENKRQTVSEGEEKK